MRACPVSVFAVGTLAKAQRQCLSLKGKLKGFAHKWQQAIIASQGPGSPLKVAIGGDWKGKLSPVVYVLGILSTFLWSWVAQVLYVAIALVWLVPDRRIEKSLRGDGH